MANLNFRYGLYDGLSNVGFNPGTIYVTTDEKALYIDRPDLPAGTDIKVGRIRIGQTVTYKKLEDFLAKAAQPEFDLGAFYYIEEGNMLLKWVGEDRETTKTDENGKPILSGGWQQVNDISDLEKAIATAEEDIDKLENRATALENAVGTEDAGTGLFGKLAVEQGRIDAVEDVLNGTKDENGETLTTGLIKDVAELQELIGAGVDGENTLTKRIEDLESSDSAQGLAITDLEKAVGKEDAGEGKPSGLFEKIANEAAKARAEEGKLSQAIADEAATAREEEGKLSDAIGVERDRIDTLTNIVNKKADKTALEKAVEDAVKRENEIKDLIEGEDGLNGKVAGIEEVLNGTDTEDGLIDKVNNLASVQGNHTTSITELQNAVNGTESTDGLLKDVAGLAEAVYGKEGEGATPGLIEDVAALQEADKAFDEAIKDIQDAIGTGDDSINSKLSSLDSRLTALDKEDGRMDVAEGDIDELERRMNAIDGAAGRMAAAEKDIDDIEKVLNGEGETPGLKARVTTLEGAVSNHNNDIKGLQGDIEGLQNNKADKTWVEEMFDAADAMRFIDSIDSIDELPAEGKGGDTYVVASNIEVTDEAGVTTIAYRAGDMLVAVEKVIDEVATFDRWEHIKTGTWKEAQDITAAAATNGGIDLKLTDATGSVVQGTGVNIKGEGVSVSGGAGNLTISLAWSSWDA